MTEPTPSRFGAFVAEMKRRHVVRFALGYMAAAFVVLQLAEIVFPAFGYGEGALRILVIVVGLGFPPATMLAWIYDITSEGIRRTEDVSGSKLAPRLALLSVTVVVMGGMGVWLAGSSGIAALGPTAADGRRGGAEPGPLQLVAYDPNAPITSIAVLPLDDFTPDSGQAYFSAGLHEELISKLSMLDALRVASRRSVARYAGTDEPISQIGRELGVDVVVEGSLARLDDQVRITLRVVHAASETQIQTLQFVRDPADALAVQAEVADALAHEFAADHDEAIFTQASLFDVKPSAQSAYLRGRAEAERGTPEGYQMALEYFTEALEEDPEFTEALSGLAGTRFVIGLDDPEGAAGMMSQALTEARMAFEMDSASLEAREVLKTLETHMPTNEPVLMGPSAPPAPEAPAREEQPVVSIDLRAIDTNLAEVNTALGRRIEESVRRRTFVRSDEVVRNAFEARRLMSTGDFGEAAGMLRVIVEKSPDMAPAWSMLARSHASAGNPSEAVEVVIDWHESGGRDAPSVDAVARLNEAVSADPERGYWKWDWARLEQLSTLGEPVMRIDLAAAAAGAGDHEAALEHLTAAIEAKEPGLHLVRSDPVWDALRSDERFRSLARAARRVRTDPRPAPGTFGR